jgi:hypothetical protein
MRRSGPFSFRASHLHRSLLINVRHLPHPHAVLANEISLLDDLYGFDSERRSHQASVWPLDLVNVVSNHIFIVIQEDLLLLLRVERDNLLSKVEDTILDFKPGLSLVIANVEGLLFIMAFDMIVRWIFCWDGRLHIAEGCRAKCLSVVLAAATILVVLVLRPIVIRLNVSHDLSFVLRNFLLVYPVEVQIFRCFSLFNFGNETLVNPGLQVVSRLAVGLFLLTANVLEWVLIGSPGKVLFHQVLRRLILERVLGKQVDVGDVCILILCLVTNFPVVDYAFATDEFHSMVVLNHGDSVLGIAKQVQELMREDVSLFHLLDEGLLAMLLVF